MTHSFQKVLFLPLIFLCTITSAKAPTADSGIETSIGTESVTAQNKSAKPQKIKKLKEGKWQIGYDINNGTAAISFENKVILPQIQGVYTLPDKISTNDYTGHKINKKQLSDVHGKGICYEITHTGKNLPVLLQRFYLYPEKNYFFTEIELVSDQEIATNYMSPLVAETVLTGIGKDLKMLFVPFDNDKWIKYDIFNLPGDFTSYEVSAFFSPVSDNGMVVGSVEHDTWKTGVKINKPTDSDIAQLECFGGITSDITRDILPHGKVKGSKVKSPKIMVGIFKDWRNGMEEYGLANSRIAPAPAWDKGTPFGWNSWGVIQEKINFNQATQVSDFFKENLQNNNFSNDSTVYIGLDSFWDNFSEEQLKEFVRHCRKNGQHAGIYWVPFTDWGRNPDRTVEGTNTLYKDVYLYANGKPQELDGAWAVDPTHPAIKQKIDMMTQRFREWGFEYIKLDFLTHGAMEADFHADSNVTTGIQAYNEGMNYLKNALGDKFFITLSISPIFPSCYAQSRRIACDAWASIHDTEYTLNGLSYGWWLNKVYRFNDPDHLVLHRGNETEGENRARITSGVITGIYMVGDDLSLGGKEIAKERSRKFLTVDRINQVARIGRSFKPVYGYQPTAEKRSEKLFMLQDGNTTYVAAFNFSTENDAIYNIPMERLGLEPDSAYSVTELWSGNKGNATKSLDCTVPKADVQIWKIEK